MISLLVLGLPAILVVQQSVGLFFSFPEDFDALDHDRVEVIADLRPQTNLEDQSLAAII
jgi:hypothetical protein